MRLRSGSLIARLSWRLILLQFFALTLVVLIASIPEEDQRGLHQLDEDVLFAIAANIAVEDDQLVIRDAARLAPRVANYPDFWLLIGDAEGRQLRHGPVPDRVLAMFGDVAAVTHAKIYRDGTEPDAGLIARRLDTPAGKVTIMTGGGPTLYPIISRLQEVNPYYLLLLIVLTVVSALSIPWLLRRDLSGVARVAEEAAGIDIDQPGTRLTEANVPPELQGMVGAVNAALTRLDEGLERRKRFLTTAAHELRTPIAILTMRIELLPPGAARRQLMLDVARLSSLADQLLDLERLDGGMVRLAPANLCLLAKEAVTDIAPLAVASQAELSFEEPADPVVILADNQSILRVVTNLVQNAIAHGGPGVSVTVEVAAPAELRVRDNGPGIAAADRAQIFEPFFRRSGAPGAGLGLHLVQEIVMRHGGTIQVTEAPGGGAEFIARFPLVPARS